MLNLNLKVNTMSKNAATIIAQACQLLAQASQQLATLAASMNAPEVSENEPKRRGRPPAFAKAAEPEKKAVQFTAQEIAKIKLLMSCGEEKNSAMAKVFALRSGGKKAAAPAKAVPTVKVAPKKKASIRMITREDVENDEYKLSEFTAHLRENGIEKDSESWNAFKAKFLELRKKFKDEIEEENSVPEEPEMSADDQLMGEFATDETGGFGGFDYTE